MRIFGFSITTILLVLAAAWIGAKNPGWYSKVPGLNKF